jgi:hypothetical protein
MNGVLSSTGERRRWWLRRIPVPAPALAASVLAAVALVAWTVASRPGGAEAPGPPEPDRVIQLEMRPLEVPEAAPAAAGSPETPARAGEKEVRA